MYPQLNVFMFYLVLCSSIYTTYSSLLLCNKYYVRHTISYILSSCSVYYAKFKYRQCLSRFPTKCPTSMCAHMLCTQEVLTYVVYTGSTYWARSVVVPVLCLQMALLCSTHSARVWCPLLCHSGPQKTDCNSYQMRWTLTI